MFLDFDRIHELNNLIGYDEVDKRIRATLNINFRSSDLVARWYSGDEIVILLDGEGDIASKKIQELRDNAGRNGLSFKYNMGTWNVGKEKIEDVISCLSKNLKRKTLEAKP